MPSNAGHRRSSSCWWAPIPLTEVLRSNVSLEYQRGNFVDVYGYGGPNTLMALIQRLHMAQYGTTLEQIGKIAMAQRENALNNPQSAVSRTHELPGLFQFADDFGSDSSL